MKKQRLFYLDLIRAVALVCILVLSLIHILKTILVTGAAGYIGRHVVKKALDMGYRVIASDLSLIHISRFGYRGEEVFKDCATLSGGEMARLRFAELALERPDILILGVPTASGPSAGGSARRRKAPRPFSSRYLPGSPCR